MTIPFTCLFVAICLPYVLTGVTTYFKRRQFGAIDNHQPRVQAAALAGAGARAYAAQQNAWEALLVFGLSVMVAHLAGADPRASAQASLLFVAARAGHAVCYVTDRAALRSACFAVGTGACLWLFGLAATAA
jgi:uncharacterized MAPEG superfamily protein